MTGGGGTAKINERENNIKKTNSILQENNMFFFFSKKFIFHIRCFVSFPVGALQRLETFRLRDSNNYTLIPLVLI